MAPPSFGRVFYTNSGSEANEAGFKVARQYAKHEFPGQFRFKTIARHYAYHGTTRFYLVDPDDPIAQTYGRSTVGPGDDVLVSEMEHHSNIVPWQMLCERSGAILRVVPINDQGELLLNEFEKLMGKRTRLVVRVSW